MARTFKAYRLNVQGDFYVVDGCCTLCGVPGVMAPELFGGFGPDGTVLEGVDHCWVTRQPVSATEIDAMIATMRSQELACIRYNGSDEQVMRRLMAAGEAKQIDPVEDNP